jgi:hypothetical protein
MRAAACPLLSSACTLVVVLASASSPATQNAGEPRALNPIQRENQHGGTTDWLLTRVEPIGVKVRDDRPRRQRAIEGYMSHTSIRAGETLTAYVSANPASRYRVAIYRLGYYGGKGGRLMKALGPLQGTPAPEPVEGDKQLMEARWPASFTVTIRADWTSGVYLAKLTTEGTGCESYLVWVVRDDRKADRKTTT